MRERLAPEGPRGEGQHPSRESRAGPPSSRCAARRCSASSSPGASGASLGPAEEPRRLPARPPAAAMRTGPWTVPGGGSPPSPRGSAPSRISWISV